MPGRDVGGTLRVLSDERGFSVDSDPDLERALNAAREGDEHGFAELWRNLQPAMFRYLRIIAGHCAEEVASKTWTEAARQLRRFEGDYADLQVWIFRLARRQAMRVQRRHSRRRVGGDTEPVAGAVQPSMTDMALGLLARLPSDQAEAVALRVVAGLDVPQIAKVLGVRDEQAQAAAVRGIRTLATMIDGHPHHTGESTVDSGEWAGEGVDL